MQTDAGQHLWIGIEGTELTAASRRLLATVQPGGIVLFARNIVSAGQLRALIRSLKTELPRPPLIALDHEGGRVNRLRPIVGRLASIATVKRARNPAAARAFGWELAGQLRELGVDVNLAPVLDLELFDAATDNGLQGRCWGRTAAEVAAWAGMFSDGLQAGGVAACPKHFPGLGGARLDSHDKLPTIRRSAETLRREDARVFVELLPRVGAVMVGHGYYPAWQGRRPQPASVAPAIVEGWLRGRFGFGGLVVTDDLAMGAVTTGRDGGAAAVAALRAGADVALLCHGPDKILAAHAALARGQGDRRRAVARIRRFTEHWVCGKRRRP